MTLVERRKLRSASRNPAFGEKLSQMRLSIAPIVHIETGQPPPSFPSSLLSLFLLTEAELDAMAEYYSQTSLDSLAGNSYPQTMDWSRPFLDKVPHLPDSCRLTDFERLRVKMRMFARFIGMRGAETPGWECERQIEILKAKIEQQILEEERAEQRKFCGGPFMRR